MALRDNWAVGLAVVSLSLSLARTATGAEPPDAGGSPSDAGVGAAPASDPSPTGDAPEDPAPPAEDAAPPSVPNQDATAVRAWWQRYAAARSLLAAGQFELAAAQLRQLAELAPSPVERSLALELAALADHWRARGLMLAPLSPGAPAPPATPERQPANQRTTDEISVLYVNSVFYGLGTGGWLAVHTEPNSAGGAILPALALGAAAGGAVALADANDAFGYGVPQTMVSAAYIGLEEGVVWTLWNQARADRVDEWEGTTVANVIWLSTSAGAVLGGVLGSQLGTTPGRASYLGSAALWTGALSGLVVGGLAPDDYAQDDRALLAAAIGLNAGAIGGALTAGEVSPSIARVRFLDLGAIGGGLVVGGLYVSAADDETEAGPLMLSLGAGIAGGLTVAWFVTDGMKKDRGPRSESAGVEAAAPRLRLGLLPVNGGVGVGAFGSL